MTGFSRRYVVLALLALAVGALATAGLVLRGGGSAARPTGLDALFAVDARTVQGCGKTDLRCYAQAFGNLAAQRGGKVALTELSKRMEQNETVRKGCHVIAHNVSFGTLRHYRGDLGKAGADGTNVCTMGFYHGLLQRSLELVPRGQLLARAREFCARFDNPVSAAARECAHGIGHGMLVSDGGDANAALRGCDGMVAILQKPCYSGVFMERYVPTAKVGTGPTVRLRDTCTPIGERFRRYCYFSVVARAIDQGVDGYPVTRTCEFLRAHRSCYFRSSAPASVVGATGRRVLHDCGEVVGVWGQACANIVGTGIADRTQDVPVLRATCASVRVLDSFCVWGAAAMIARSADLRSLVALCGAPGTLDADACAEGTGRGLRSTNRPHADAAAICARFPRVLAQRCADGLSNAPLRDYPTLPNQPA